MAAVAGARNADVFTRIISGTLYFYVWGKNDTFYTLHKFVPEAQHTSYFASFRVLLKMYVWELRAPKSRAGPYRTGTITLLRRCQVLLPFSCQLALHRH